MEMSESTLSLPFSVKHFDQENKKKGEQLVYKDEMNRLKLNEQLANNTLIERIGDKPVFVLSAVGPRRTGKSTMMNRVVDVLRNLNLLHNNEYWKHCLKDDDSAENGFRAEDNHCHITEGIWICPNVFWINDPGEKSMLYCELTFESEENFIQL